MSTDYWFTVILFIGVWLCALILLDGAHKAHIAALKQVHAAELAGLRGYIRTLNRERKYLEAELAKYKARVALRQEVGYDPVHIQYLPPSEEYDGDG
jgi:hypothetical protein